MIPTRHIVVGATRGTAPSGEPPKVQRAPRRLVGWRASAIGLVLGCVFGAALPAVAAWLVQGEGEVGARLASLEPLKVGKATVVSDDIALPGKTIRLQADVENPNPTELTILGSDLKNLSAGDCDVTGLKYHDNNKLDITEGRNEKVVLGRLVLPELLANRCQGSEITAVITVRAAYGRTD